MARPNTILVDSAQLESVDSAQLESGEALDTDFREMAASGIDQFKREMVERTGDITAGDKIDESTLLREVMNTVGKKGKLGEQIRCVVSVSMLTEGWDANTVTHVLGVRAFGTQLLCEQVVGRALRRVGSTSSMRTSWASLLTSRRSLSSPLRSRRAKPFASMP